MAIISPIVELGNPILRQKAKEIEMIDGGGTQELIDDMIDTCKAYEGQGIAAPQMGHSLRLFIIASNPNSRYPHAPKMEPTAIINPTIIAPKRVAEHLCEDGYEGCLSIPGIRGIVRRYTSVKTSFFDRSGKAQEMVFKGFLARIFQHEFDHIEGIVFTDRADPKSLITEKEYQRMLRAKKP